MQRTNGLAEKAISGSFNFGEILKSMRKPAWLAVLAR